MENNIQKEANQKNEMNQEEYLDDDDDLSSMSSSQSDLSQESDSFKQYDEPNDFGALYHNKQVETLKHLRQLLSENKILKKRLNLVEAELEQYQEFKGLVPLKDFDRDSDDESEINEDLLKTTEDKEIQTELVAEPNTFEQQALAVVAISEIKQEKQESKLETPLLPPPPAPQLPKTPPKSIIKERTNSFSEEKKLKESEKSKAFAREESNHFLKSTNIDPIVKPLSPEPVVTSKQTKTTKSVKINDVPQVEIIKPIEVVVKLNKDTQTENDILYVKQISELKEQIELIQKEKDAELAKINMANLELKLEVENLKRINDSVYKDYEAISDKFNEYRLMNMDTDHEVVLLKEKNLQLQYEIDQQEKQLRSKEEQLLSKISEIEVLNENSKFLKESTKIINEQQKQIEYLVAENEKHQKEKHIICQQKISELTNECNSYAEFIKTQNQEMKNQLDHIGKLNIEIEKLRLEQQNFNFKEFVSLKRELNFLKQEKERKFADEVIQPNSISNAVVLAQQPLPPIKENKKSLFKFFN